MIKRLYLILVCLVLVAFTSYAQPNFNLYQLQSLGQTNLMNPAHMPRYGFTLGIPMIYQHMQSPGITAHDIFRSDLDANQTINRILDDPNINFRNINITNEITPIFMGLRWRKNYFSMGAYTHVNFNYGFPKDIFGLLYSGNASQRYFGKEVKFNDFDISALGMAVFHTGYTREINQKWSVGGRFKFINGLFNLNTERVDAYLKTDSGQSNAYRITAYANYRFQASGYNTAREFIDSDNVETGALLRKAYLDAPLGRGYGIDIGVNFRPNKKWHFSASLLDIGRINWKNDAKILKKEALYVFEGVQSTNADSFENEFDKVLDSLQVLFKPEQIDQAYTTNLIPKLYLGAQYNLTNSTRLNAVFYGDIFKGNFRHGISLAVSQSIWRFLDLRLNYNYFNNGIATANFGGGLVLNLTPMQIFAMSDNLGAVLNPEKAYYTNVRFGMNFIVGSNWDRDGDGIKDRKDKCKKEYGLWQYKGCPDTDGDGIADPDDKCPKEPGSPWALGCPDMDKDSVPDFMDSCVNVAGLRSLNGCPDADGDGIADKDDACPNEFGKKELNGCPDDDNDGIINSNDSCVSEAGPPETNGCPDRDGDGIADKDDLCPDIKGTIEGKGCLDRDGDGINDPDDACPDEAGLLKFQGCPDRDGDGIPDKDDKCPDIPGNPSNNGCPVIKQSVLKVFEKALTGVQFESGKDVILKTSFPILNDVVKILNENPSYRLFIAGHTDNTGNADKNMQLSKDRAAAVKKYLINKGIDIKRLSSEGFGDTKPIADNKTQAGRAKNRRVEFKVQFEDFVEVE
jgi:outer membrane protein OmpA-like peptidoglycan-associated protein